MPQSTTRKPSRFMPLAVAGAALLAVAGGVLFYYATQTATGPERGDIHKVTVVGKTCDPNDFTVPAGRTTFEIHNASDRPLEWEILDGVMVVAERENIAPGFHSLLTVKLKPGTFEITCGLLSNPRGRLVVTPSAESEAERMRPPIQAFIGPLSEFKVYLTLQSAALIKESENLAAAIRAGDIEKAKTLYLAARLPYKRMESVTGRIADLENAIDPLADYLEKREEDPAFTGFHRIEYALFSQGSLEGLEPVADKLVADVTVLKTRLREMRLLPEDLAGSAEQQARRLADGQVRDGESRYAFTDLAEFEANVEGMEKSVMLLDPLVSDAAPDVAAGIRERFAAIKTALASHRDADGYGTYDRLDAAAKERLASAFAALADEIARLNTALGLE